MTTFFYILSESADADLVEIFDYTTNKFGFNQAEKYLLEMEDILCFCLNIHIQAKNVMK